MVFFRRRARRRRRMSFKSRVDDGGGAVSEAWSTEEPLTVDRLIAEFLTRGTSDRHW